MGPCDLILVSPTSACPRASRSIAGRVPPRRLPVAMELALGVPVVHGRASRGPIRAVIDSGASLSYVPANVVRGLTPVDKRTDFYAGFGEFETNVYRLRVEVGARAIDATAGVLPPRLGTMFGALLGNDGWIIGSDFFRGRTNEIDYAGQRFVDLCHDAVRKPSRSLGS